MAQITKAEIKEFVEAAHGDYARIQELLSQTPELRDMANGHETALGAACQMRRTDIVEFLLSQGAAPNISTACVLGKTDQVAAFLAADPSLLNKGCKQSHNKHPLYFAEQQPAVLELLRSRGAK